MLTTRYGRSRSPRSSSSIASSRSCSSRAAAGGREDEHLHLVELVHAEHAARVLAGGARLAAEVRRVAGVPQRQRVRVEDLLHVHRGEPDLGGAGEVELVALDLVDVRPRRSAGSRCRTSPPRARAPAAAPARIPSRRAGRARSGRARARGARRRRCDRRSARPRPSPRVPCRSSRTPARGRGGRARGSRTRAARRRARTTTASSSVKPSGVASSGGFGIRSRSSLRRRLRRGELLLERLQLDLHLLELGELLRRRLALQLPLRAQLLDARLHREHGAVGLEQLVEELAPRPCARGVAEGRPGRCGRRAGRSRA